MVRQSLRGAVFASVVFIPGFASATLCLPPEPSGAVLTPASHATVVYRGGRESVIGYTPVVRYGAPAMRPGRTITRRITTHTTTRRYAPQSAYRTLQEAGYSYRMPEPVSAYASAPVHTPAPRVIETVYAPAPAPIEIGPAPEPVWSAPVYAAPEPAAPAYQMASLTYDATPEPVMTAPVLELTYDAPATMAPIYDDPPVAAPAPVAYTPEPTPPASGDGSSMYEQLTQDIFDPSFETIYDAGGQATTSISPTAMVYQSVAQGGMQPVYSAGDRGYVAPDAAPSASVSIIAPEPAPALVAAPAVSYPAPRPTPAVITTPEPEIVVPDGIPMIDVHTGRSLGTMPAGPMTPAPAGYQTQGGLPDDIRTACMIANGVWLEEYRECENAEPQWCAAQGGRFDECASACRHEPGGGACIQVCVPVCSL